MEQNKLSIAVIIPAYNVAPYIEEAIQSVLEQPYPYITIVCVNDGSTDNTRSILLELSSKSGGRVVCINQQNGGVSTARNTGIEYVLNNLKTDYIMFLDGDDVWRSGWCTSEAIKPLHNGYDVVLFDYCNADFNLKMCGPSLHAYTGIMDGGDSAVNIDHQHFAASAYKRELIEHYHIRFHLGQKLGEDIQFALEARSLAKEDKVRIMV